MKTLVNNRIYDELGCRWYDADDDPVALLRSENRARFAWIHERIASTSAVLKVLDVGCGAGFFTNPTAKAGFDVTGVDLSEMSLDVAKSHDQTKKVRYVLGDATRLDFADNSFDVVCALDMLEHVEFPEKVVAEISRVLRPGGQFFFYTFNRNIFSYLVIIKGVEWFVRNVPKDLHIYRLFIKPIELDIMMRSSGLQPVEWSGLRPKIGKNLLRLIFTGIVPKDFEFLTTQSLALGYLGFAKKE